MSDYGDLKQFFSEEVDFESVTSAIIPFYELLHQTTVDLLLSRVADRTLAPASIVDIGAGTGYGARKILELGAGSKVVAIDFCPAMLRKLRENLPPDLTSRCLPIQADFLDPECEPSVLEASLSSAGFGPPAAVVTTLTFHHFTSEQLTFAYRRAFDLLPASGTLIVADLFSFDANWLTELAQRTSLDWIRHGLLTGVADSTDHKALEERWITHYSRDNRPLPIRASGVQGSISHEMILEKTGFTEIEVPLRIWQLGVLIATKPAHDSLKSPQVPPVSGAFSIDS